MYTARNRLHKQCASGHRSLSMSDTLLQLKANFMDNWRAHLGFMANWSSGAETETERARDWAGRERDWAREVPPWTPGEFLLPRLCWTCWLCILNDTLLLHLFPFHMPGANYAVFTQRTEWLGMGHVLQQNGRPSVSPRRRGNVEWDPLPAFQI